jgi:hypothetical protein
MKSLETQLAEKDAELKELRQKLQEPGSGKRNANTVDIVEAYKGLGLSHRGAVNAARVESAVIDLTQAQHQLIESARSAGLSDAEAVLFAIGRGPDRICLS